MVCEPHEIILAACTCTPWIGSKALEAVQHFDVTIHLQLLPGGISRCEDEASLCHDPELGSRANLARPTIISHSDAIKLAQIPLLSYSEAFEGEYQAITIIQPPLGMN